MTRTVCYIEVLCLGFLILAGGSSIAETPTIIFRFPESFSELPPTVSSSLAKEGCRIPQATIERKIVATNVITGEFAQKNQMDWAILCSKDGRSYIRVFWGGAAHCPSRIDKGRDISPVDIAQGLEFDRALGTVDRSFILQHYQAYGGPKPPTITHLGINYAYLEKASQVHYCYNNKWLKLTGAD